MRYCFKIGEQTITAYDLPYMPKVGDIFAFNTLGGTEIISSGDNWLRAKKMEYVVDKIVIEPYVELLNAGIKAMECLTIDGKSICFKIYLKPITDTHNTD